MLAQAAEHAPDELQTGRRASSLERASTALDEALRGGGLHYDALAESPDAAEVSAAVNDPAFTVAGDRIEAYKHPGLRPLTPRAARWY